MLLWELALNALVFMGFLTVAVAHHWLVHKRAPTARESLVHGLWSGVLTPASLDALKDFIVHFIVYSGHIIPTH